MVKHEEVIKYRKDGTAYIEAQDIGRYLGGFTPATEADQPKRDNFREEVNQAMNLLWT